MWKRLSLFTSFSATILVHAAHVPASNRSKNSVSLTERFRRKPTTDSVAITPSLNESMKTYESTTQKTLDTIINYFLHRNPQPKNEFLIKLALSALEQEKPLIAQASIRYIIRHIPQGKDWIKLYQERIALNKNVDHTTSCSVRNYYKYVQSGHYPPFIPGDTQKSLKKLNELIQKELSQAASLTNHTAKQPATHHHAEYDENRGDAHQTILPLKLIHRNAYEHTTREINRSSSHPAATQKKESDLRVTRGEKRHYSHNFTLPTPHNDRNQDHRTSFDSKNSFIIKTTDVEAQPSSLPLENHSLIPNKRALRQ